MIDRHSLFVSAGIHLCALILILLPWSFTKNEWEISKPIPVRIVSIGALTQSPSPISKKEFNRFKEITTTEKPKSTTAPIPEKTFKDIKKRASKVAVKIKSTKQEAQEKIPVAASTPTAPQKKQDMPTQSVQTQKEAAFQSVLKSLQHNIENTSINKSTDPHAFEADNISDHLSISELDALRQQIQECWYVQQSIWEDHQIVVEAIVEIDPERKVSNITIKNPPMGFNRAAFQAAADSVKQALRAPECTPLALPPDKYHQWKKAKFIFSPKGVW